MDTSQKVEATLDLCKIINGQHRPPESEPGVALTLNFLVRVGNEQRLGVVARGLEQVLYVLS